jgi:hypothetical protein
VENRAGGSKKEENLKNFFQKINEMSEELGEKTVFGSVSLRLGLPMRVEFDAGGGFWLRSLGI